MGMDPITIGLGIGGATSIWNAIQGNKSQKEAQKANDRNFGLQQQVYNDQQGALNRRNQMIEGLVLPMLGGSGFNTGQDGMMQQMRGLPDGRFDTSGYFDAIRKLSNQDLNDQISQQRGQAGSLGQRFGTAQQGIEARLRERATVGLGAQYAQTGLQAFESAANRRQGGMLGLLGLLAGQQTNSGAATPQMPIMQTQNQIPGALGDIGNMIMMYPFLKDLGGAGGGAPTRMPSVPQSFMPLTPDSIFNQGSLFKGIRF